MAVIVRDIDEIELERLIAEDKKVLADFYSTQCGPCKMLGFVLNDVAKNVDNIEIVKLDFDQNKEALKKHNVSGYPTIILFKEGCEVERVKGLQQKPIILKMING